MINDKQQADSVNIQIYARSDACWIAMFILVVVILTWGDPDLLDVLQEFCRRYIEKEA